MRRGRCVRRFDNGCAEIKKKSRRFCYRANMCVRDVDVFGRWDVEKHEDLWWGWLCFC